MRISTLMIGLFFSMQLGLQAQCAPGAEPEAAAFAIQPSCAEDGVTVNSNGYIQLSSVTGGLSYEVNLGSSIDGSGTRTTLTAATYPLQVLTGLANPAGSQDYTVRIYAADVGGDATCFLDVVVIMNEQDCSVGCDCQEVIYLNEPVIGAVLKFEIGPGSLLTEVVGENGGTPPNQHWYPGLGTSELPSPHGLTFDLNGNLYVGSHFAANSPIRKFNCDGVISPEDGTTVTNQSILTNMFSIDNTLYTSDNNGPGSYDLCTGDFLGRMCLNDAAGNPLADDLTDPTFNNWGLSYNQTLETVYVTGARPFKQAVYVFTRTELEAGVAGGACIDPLFVRNAAVDFSSMQVGDAFLPSNIGALSGIVSDNAGNIYVAVWLTEAGNPGSVLKYNANGGFLGSALLDPAFAVTRGIVWSEETNRIYASNTTDVTV